MIDEPLDLIQIVIDHLRDGLPESKFKEIYYGDPELIPSFNLPALIVDLTDESIPRTAHGEDEPTENIVIKVVYNKKDDWTHQIKYKDTTLYRIREVVGRRSKKSEISPYESGTIKFIVRNMIEQGLLSVADDVTINYETVLRSGGEEPVVTAEALITVPIRYPVYVNDN